MLLSEYADEVVRLAEEKRACWRGVAEFRCFAEKAGTVAERVASRAVDAKWVTYNVCLDAVPAFRDAMYLQLGITSTIWEGGRLHCEDGPAIVWEDGLQEWYYHGKRHREDGPAVRYSDGSLEWWYGGRLYKLRDVAGVCESTK